MYILFVCFWAIGLFILMKEFRSESDIWVALSFVFYGFGGLAGFLQSLNCNGKYEIIPAISLSFAMFWASYALLIYALHYTGKMPLNKTRRRIVMIGCSLPFILIYLFTPLLPLLSDLSFPIEAHMFWYKASAIALDWSFLIAAIVATPYYVVSIVLLSDNLIHRNTAIWQREAVSAYILVVPIGSTFYIADILLPCFGYYEFWQINIGVIIAQSILFLLLVIRRNAFGLFYYQRNATSDQVGKSVVDGISVLQHALKNNILAIRLALQNAQYDYSKEEMKPEVVKNDIQLALKSSKHLLSVLDRVELKVHPVGLNFEKCLLLPVINDVIEQCQPELTEKNIVVEHNYNANPQIYCDPVHLREVLLNLVNNAIEALEYDGSGRIVFSVNLSKHKVIIQIIDNGCGMDKEQIKKIGTPLITSKLGGKHYGLGLYYVKKVINMHDGRFTLQRGVSGGMVACVTLASAR